MSSRVPRNEAQEPSPGLPYSYRCVDHSRLTAWISAQVAPRVERRLPADWSANTVTRLGSGLMWGLLGGVLIVDSPWRESLAPLWVALLWSYCVLDHVDGCRARRRRTSSAWGEFLDHGLDAWHGCIAVFALGMMGLAVRPGVLVATLAGVGLATLVTWLEQKLRGTFTLGRLGPVEAVLAAGFFLLAWSWTPTALFLRSLAPGGLGFTWAEVVMLAGAGGSLVTVAVVTVRSPGVAAPLGAAAAIAAAVIALAATQHQPWWCAGLAVAIVLADYSIRVIGSHLTHAPMPWPDVAGAALLALAIPFPAGAPLFAVAALLWLAGRVMLQWSRLARKLSAPTVAPAPVALALTLD